MRSFLILGHLATTAMLSAAPVRSGDSQRLRLPIEDEPSVIREPVQVPASPMALVRRTGACKG